MLHFGILQFLQALQHLGIGATVAPPPLFLVFASIFSGNFIGKAIEFNLVLNQLSVWSILTFEEEVEECPGARVVIHIGRGAEVFSRGSVSKWVEVVRVDSAPDPTSSWTTIGPHL